MSGSGGNAFLDLLRAMVPAATPAAIAWLLAALLSIAAAAVLAAIAWAVGTRAERRFARAPASEPAGPVLGARAGAAEVLAWAGIAAGLAAWPWAPHLFFADLDLGAFAALALLSLAAWSRALEGGGSAAAARAIATSVLVTAALLAGVVASGSANWIEASRAQGHAAGLAWAAFTNPFAALAVVVVFGAEAAAGPTTERAPAAEHARLFLVCALAAAFLLGGFESPLTWSLRRSLGEDPGFLNHAVLADGTTELRIAIGGLAYQAVCALTLLVKTALGVLAVHMLRSARPRWKLLSPASGARVSHRALAPLALVAALGAAIWEWALAP